MSFSIEPNILEQKDTIINHKFFGTMQQPFYRRTFEKPFQKINMPPHYYGFTNRILTQELPKQKVNLFIPTYAILKIKSIQSLDIQSLTGTLNAVIIVKILIEGLPAPLVHLLKEGVEIQINRSELLFLRDNTHEQNKEGSISLKQSKKMLTFTIRKVLTTTIYEDTLWSPFEIIRLVASVTFNSIKKDGEQVLANYLQHQEQQFGKNSGNNCSVVGLQDFSAMDQKSGNFSYHPNSKTKSDIKLSKTHFSISFNCMRNGIQIPISYALGINYSLYDLAENLLETYYTKEDSYTGVMEEYKNIGKQQKKHKKSNKKEKKVPNSQPPKQKNFYKYIDKYDFKGLKSHQQKQQCLKEIFDNSLVGSQDIDIKKQTKKMPKAHYYQYAHFVIPLYKYPGNSLATIFIPVFLLSLLSLSIFFQDNDLSSRIGSIATMVLGYIALIPSIKEQLPPSSRLAHIQIVIYLSTLCCMLSLAQSFLIDDMQNYIFNWRSNFLFLICLFVHCTTFILVISMLLIHKYVWEPSYNKTTERRLTDPETYPQEWINFFCDEQFYSANKKIYQWNKNPENNKKIPMITKYIPEIEDEEESKVEQQPSMLATKETSQIGLYSNPTSPRVLKKGQKACDDPIVEGKFMKEKGSRWQQKGTGAAPESKGKNKEGKVVYYKLLLQYLDGLIVQGKHVSFRLKSKQKVKRRNQLTKDILKKLVR